MLGFKEWVDSFCAFLPYVISWKLADLPLMTPRAVTSPVCHCSWEAPGLAPGAGMPTIPWWPSLLWLCTCKAGWILAAAGGGDAALSPPNTWTLPRAPGPGRVKHVAGALGLPQPARGTKWASPGEVRNWKRFIIDTEALIWAQPLHYIHHPPPHAFKRHFIGPNCLKVSLSSQSPECKRFCLPLYPGFH